MPLYCRASLFSKSIFTRYRNAPDFVNKNASFRNKVVHKGYIPTKQETFEYAKGAFEYITSILAILKKDYHSSIMRVTFMNIQEAVNRSDGPRISTFAQASFIGLISGKEGWNERNFDDEMPKFFQQRKTLDTALHGMANQPPR